ncbi:MAG TPA: hypothetical protein VFK04_01975 [Gemmatimonadaceae bacterium]|nr:hypothetical protein [Gemmatimonadaceae bacterium]
MTIEIPERAVPTDSREPDHAPSFKAEWRESYGQYWWMDLALFGLIVFLLGAMQPLRDADLPMHLATGEWIVRHRAVPFIEPFAWTRAGAQYYAYSWALELAYYLVMRWGGPAALHLLQGALLLSVAGAMLVLARAARWKPWVALCMAAANVAAAMLVVPALRPQLVLFALIPLAWAWAYLILESARIRWAVIALLLTSSAAANSHLFFVLTAAPIALLASYRGGERRRVVAVCAAILGGWLLSPYALAWPEVFRLNFGYNALLVKPSPILEFRPGFRASTGLLLAIPLALLPWAIPRSRFERRELNVHGALWVIGLVAFAYAGRLLLCWWLITLPLSAAVLGAIDQGSRHSVPRRSVRIATYSIAALLIATLAGTMPSQWHDEEDSFSRRLPVDASISIEPLLNWLECHVRPGAGGRIYTWFNYGSYLAWRLPGYSASIDGRTIFPDSVAASDMLASGLLPRRPYHVWSSADLAIIPRYFGVAAALDSAPEWGLAASLHRPAAPADSVALWVKRSWWRKVSNGTLPERGVILTETRDDSAAASCGSATANEQSAP